MRIHELAAELGVSSQEVLRVLHEQGEFVKSASSTVESPVARRVRERFTKPSSPYLRSPRPIPRAIPRPAPPSPRRAGPQTDDAGGRSQYGWSANPVKEPTAPEVVNKVRSLERMFPEAADLRSTLQRLGSQFVYVSFNHHDCALALVRFSGAIESAFGLTREVMFFFTPYDDLQVRVLERVKKAIHALPHQITPDIVFVSAPDLRIYAKMQDWTKPEFLAIPLLSQEGLDPAGVINRIKQYVYARDLFNLTTPVKGGQFFGRKTLLQALHGDIKNQRVAGIFGLRKAGKTSVLKQLQVDLESTETITVFLDLEAFPAPPTADPVPDIIKAATRKLRDVLRSRDLRTSDLNRLSRDPSIPDFKIALEDVLSRLAGEGLRLVLMLDEIEFLTPSDQIDVAEGPMPQIAQFIAALRSIVQERGNFTFLLSGLTSAIVEGGRLYGRPNPLFSWAKPYYVGPLSRPEADELATTIGFKMGVEIEPSALKALYDASGGHAFLYRNLASAVVDRLSEDILRRRITNSDVLYAIGPWRGDIRGSIEEMISHVRRYYPVESILLDALSESSQLFSEMAHDEPQALNHLTDLGLITKSDNNYTVNTLLELL